MAADLVGRPRIARVDQQIAVRVDVDRVDVEPVPRSARRGWERLLALAERNVVRAVPLEQDPAGSDVDFLDDPVDHRLVRGAADRSQVRGRGCVGQDECGVPRCDQELVAVGAEAVAGVHRGDLLIAVVVDVVGAAGESAEARSLPACEDRLAEYVWVRKSAAVSPCGAGVEPDDIAARIEDLGAVGVGGSCRPSA